MAIVWLVYPEDLTKQGCLERELNESTITAMAGADNGSVSSSRKSPHPASQPDPLSLRARNRLDNRLRVARMFRPFVREKIEGARPSLPAGLKRYSINALARYVSHDDQDAAHNFKRRWLKPTLPVLHLAIAFDLISTLRFGASQSIYFSVHDAEFIDSVLQSSIWREPFVLDNPLHRADPALLIRLRPD